MMDTRIEQQLRDGWKKISEDTRGSYIGPNAGLPPISPTEIQPSTSIPRGERVGTPDTTVSISFTAKEKQAVYALLNAAMEQFKSDGSIGNISEISTDLNSAIAKLR
jgi:hypothetical protein